MRKQIIQGAALVGIPLATLTGSQASSPKFGHEGQVQLRSVIQPAMKHIAERALWEVERNPGAGGFSWFEGNRNELMLSDAVQEDTDGYEIEVHYDSSKVRNKPANEVIRSIPTLPIAEIAITHFELTDSGTFGRAKESIFLDASSGSDEGWSAAEGIVGDYSAKEFVSNFPDSSHAPSLEKAVALATKFTGDALRIADNVLPDTPPPAPHHTPHIL